MGNQNSTDVTDLPFKEGYNILKVQANSPGSKAGLIPFFDFIVQINDISLSSENKEELVEQLKSSVDQSTKLTVYNSKEDEVRHTVIVPSESWGGSGLIGVSIRLCSLADANEHVWHVLEVFPNSPASSSGLMAFSDYIVGTPQLVFTSDSDFYHLVENNLGKEIPLYVYNLKSDHTRLVKIVPNPNWGGVGSLGCNVGYGLLHRIPTKRNQAASIAYAQQQRNNDEKSTTNSLQQPNSSQQTATSLQQPNSPQQTSNLSQQTSTSLQQPNSSQQTSNSPQQTPNSSQQTPTNTTDDLIETISLEDPPEQDNNTSPATTKLDQSLATLSPIRQQPTNTAEGESLHDELELISQNDETTPPQSPTKASVPSTPEIGDTTQTPPLSPTAQANQSFEELQERNRKLQERLRQLTLGD